MRSLLAALALLLTLSAFAETPASVDDMAWLAGRWTGTGLGGRCEEVWSPPDAGVMLGTFRLIRDGKPVFYEFLTVSVVEDRLVMRLKHFNPDMTGWETPEKFVEFKHVRTAGNTVEFEGLKFRRDDDDHLTITLRLRGKDGAVREEIFEMTRAR